MRGLTVEIPARYSDPAGEYRAAREAAALADLSHWGRWIFKGPDRHKFLNGLLTNDVKNLRSGLGFPCCLLTPKGNLVSHFFLYDLGESLWAVLPPKAVAPMKETLSRYIPLSRTEMEDAGSSWTAFLVAGPRGAVVLERVLGPTPPLGGYACRSVSSGGRRAHVLSFPAVAPDGCLVLSPASEAGALWEALLEEGKTEGIQALGAQALEMLRLESGFPVFGVDMDSDTLPLEARLESAISFTKGCYMGQETVSRIQNLGHVNRLLTGLKAEGPVSPGDAVLAEGHAIGKITSAAHSPRLNSTLALAMVRAEYASPGTRLTVRGQERPAEVVALPV